MQDYPKLLAGTPAVVGFTQFERWLAFSPVKNSLAEAKTKQAQKSMRSTVHMLHLRRA